MQAQSLIYPMATLFLLTIVVMMLMLFFRVKAVLTRKLPPGYFKLNKGADVPDFLVAITQNYNNLLELPILFYAICIIALIINREIENFIIFAWLYVLLRYIHSLIHITYNHIVHRLSLFAASCAVLISMWVKVVVFIS